jgi:hypothetical protein
VNALVAADRAVTNLSQQPRLTQRL